TKGFVAGRAGATGPRGLRRGHRRFRNRYTGDTAVAPSHGGGVSFRRGHRVPAAKTATGQSAVLLATESAHRAAARARAPAGAGERRRPRRGAPGPIVGWPVSARARRRIPQGARGAPRRRCRPGGRGHSDAPARVRGAGEGDVSPAMPRGVKARKISVRRELTGCVRRVAGVDEAGRGPLAGPVVAAAVILDPRRRIPGLADSKLLTPEAREALAPRIRARAVAWAVAWADREEIDAINILQATLLAMRRALLALPIVPTHVRIDGDCTPHLADLPLACTVEAIIGGDRTVAS